MSIYVKCPKHGYYANPHGCPLCPIEDAGIKWYGMNIRERRNALDRADLWDGNTYAMRGWEELPFHIRKELTLAIR